MMGTQLPETCRENKRIKKICAPSWFFLQDYKRIHDQQNIKFCSYIVPNSIIVGIVLTPQYFISQNQEYNQGQLFSRFLW